MNGCPAHRLVSWWLLLFLLTHKVSCACAMLNPQKPFIPASVPQPTHALWRSSLFFTFDMISCFRFYKRKARQQSIPACLNCATSFSPKTERPLNARCLFRSPIHSRRCRLVFFGCTWTQKRTRIEFPIVVVPRWKCSHSSLPRSLPTIKHMPDKTEEDREDFFGTLWCGRE